MRAIKAAIMAALAGTIGAMPAAAQGGATRNVTGAESSAFADSLARIRDSMQVRQLERAVPALRDDASPELHLRYALIEKRVFELTLDDDARKRAQHSFDKAKDQDQDNTWAHYGYGWALTHGPEFKESFSRFIPGAATISALGGVFGIDALSRAKRSLQKALDIDPGFEPAVVELSRLALMTKQPKDVATAASAARKAIGAGHPSATIYAQLAELEMLRGNGAAAAEAARAGMTLKPDGTSQHALGVALLAVPGQEEEGANAYLAGLNATAFGDSALASVYVTDVAPLLTDPDRAAFAELPQNERAQWIKSFWERSAAKAGRSLGERLAEHFSRMQYAYAHYLRNGKFAMRSGNAFLIDGDNKKLPFDDRGLIYVRLGKPDVVISTPPGDLAPPPNESWVYSRDGRNEMYTFHQYSNGVDFVLSPLEECDPYFIKFGQQESDRHKDMGTITAAFSVPKGGIGGDARYLDYLAARAKYQPELAGYMTRCQNALNDLGMLLSPVKDDLSKAGAADRLFGPPPHVYPYSSGAISELRADATRFAKEAQRTAFAALKADDARPKFTAPLQAITQLYAFRGTGDETAVTAAVLIPGERFTPQTRDGMLIYSMSLSLIMIDSVTGRIERNDTKPVFRADQAVSKGKWFRATVDLNTAPSKQDNYRVVIENTANTSQGDIRSGSQKVPSFAGDALMVSDLVIAEPGEGRWKRGRTEINPIPSHQVEHEKQFKLFYEIYNMPAEAKYRTTIRLSPKDSGGGIGGAIKSLFGKGKPVELTFDDVAGASDAIFGLQQTRTIGADMDPGEYEMTVTITNTATQATASRTTKLVVLGPKDLTTK